MTQYIDKEGLVEKIEKTINSPYPKHDQQCDWEDGYCSGLYKALNIIEDTFEVKEVDLLTPEEIKKICTIYENLKQERECSTVLYNSDETFFNHVLMVYKTIVQNIKEEVKKMEVKEVDFGTEVYKYIDEHFRVYDDGNQTLQNKDKHTLIGRVDAENIAKHFFELGLKTQKGE